MPQIDNSNVDKSLGLIHSIIVRCLRKIGEGKSIYDPLRKQTQLLNLEYNRITKNQMSSKQARELIHQRVNRDENVERFLEMRHESAPGVVGGGSSLKRGYSDTELEKGDEIEVGEDEEEEEEVAKGDGPNTKEAT